MRILYVEDQRVFAETVATQFLAEHHVAYAACVAAARETISREVGYDAVLVDYDLPDGKGTEVVRALRAARFKGLIVAVSGKEDGNAELRAAGAHAICKKTELHRIATVLQRGPAR